MKILNIPPEESRLGIIIALNRIELTTRDIIFNPEDYFVLKPGFKYIFKLDGIYVEKDEE